MELIRLEQRVQIQPVNALFPGLSSLAVSLLFIGDVAAKFLKDIFQC